MTKEEFFKLRFPETTEDVIAILMKFRYKTVEQAMRLLCVDYNKETDTYTAYFANAINQPVKDLAVTNKDPEKALWILYQNLHFLFNGTK